MLQGQTTCAFNKTAVSGLVFFSIDHSLPFENMQFSSKMQLQKDAFTICKTLKKSWILTLASFEFECLNYFPLFLKSTHNASTFLTLNIQVMIMWSFIFVLQASRQCHLLKEECKHDLRGWNEGGSHSGCQEVLSNTYIMCLKWFFARIAV